MASSKEYLIYVLDLLREEEGISYKKMMGEYILYKNNIIFGGIYDNIFLVKKTPSLKDKGLEERIPYPNAKAMCIIDNENPNEVSELIKLVYNDLRK